FVVRLRDRNARLTPAARKFASQMEDFYSNTGVTKNPRGRDNFNTYLRKIARDSLIYDAHSSEIVPNKKGLPCEFYAVDASTIRLAQSAKAHIDEDLDDETRYVQIYDGTIIAEFTQNEMSYGVRNPNTNIRLQGYGTSELEMLVETITNLINGFDYNARYFTQNSAPKGLINIKAGMSEKMLSKFKNQWYAMLSGVENAWRTPITNAEAGIEWINMQQSNQEMGFQAWIDLLIKCTCSVYCISPDEIGHPYGNAGQVSTLSQGSNRDKIIESRERGLRPLLSHIAHCINTHIMWPMHEDFKFEFVGLDAMTREQLADLNSKRVRSSWTVNEIRAEEDLPPLPDGKGDIILDPTWLQSTMAAQQQPMMGGYGQDDAAGGVSPDGGDANDREYAEEDKDENEEESDGEQKQLTRALTRLTLPGTQSIDIVRKSKANVPLLKIKL
ncbi:MAG: phage portal protein, partial [Cytophagaceae bacterium]